MFVLRRKDNKKALMHGDWFQNGEHREERAGTYGKKRT